MNTFRAVGVGALAALLAASGYGGEVVAQGYLACGGRSANSGRRELRAGFTPDPVRVRVTSRGAIDVSALNLGAGCRGFVTQRPDWIVNLRGASLLLRFYVVAPRNTTLVINSASGRWHCNDDSNGGTNPMVDIANAGAGQYDIWVGTHRAGQITSGQLFVSESTSNHP